MLFISDVRGRVRGRSGREVCGELTQLLYQGSS